MIYKSDKSLPFTISASDVDDTELSISVTYTKNGSRERNGLPLGLSINNGSCNRLRKGKRVRPGSFPGYVTPPFAFPRASECTWTVSKTGEVPYGLYKIFFFVTDKGGGTTKAQTYSTSFKVRLGTKLRNSSKARKKPARQKKDIHNRKKEKIRPSTVKNIFADEAMETAVMDVDYPFG